MTFFLAVFTALFIADLLWWHRADRLLRGWPRGRAWRAVVALFVGGELLTLVWIVFGGLFSDRPDEALPSSILAAAYIWHLVVLPASLVTWLLISIVRGVGSIARRSRRSRSEPVADRSLIRETESASRTPAQHQLESETTSRRQFLGIAAAAIPPIVTGGATAVGFSQLANFRVRPMTLVLPQLPPNLDGLTIAHVTDIHVGRFTSGRVLDGIVERTNALRADLVLLTGDLINHAISHLPDAVALVKRMDARYGVFMVEGNHDLFQGRSAFDGYVKSHGIPLLVNESTVLRIRNEAVQMLGLRWGGGVMNASRIQGRGEAVIAESMRELTPQLIPGTFPILMAHHPHAFDHAVAAGIPLTLSGHTHGGQLMLTPNLGAGPLMFRYWSGLYRKGNSQLVVSNGTGNWFPLRINAPAEIIHLTLRRG